MMSTPGNARLHRWERVGLIAFAILLIGFGVVTEIRSAFQSSPKTDLDVYLKAAWAARVGLDIYTVTDVNGWHYCYPPTFALLLTPVASPPPIAPQAGYPPFWLTVALWYLLSVACVFYTTHVFASIVLPDAERGSRRWWYARMVPVYVCLGGIGHTLSRGQVNTLLVALVAASFAAMMTNRRVRSGLWLAGAITLKVIPAYLLMYPVLRRDSRTLGGVALGLVVLLGVIPSLWWGPDGAIDSNRRVLELVLKPGTTGDGDQSRARELTDSTSTDSQSFQALIHALRHPDRATRPAKAERETRLAHWGICGVLTLIAAWIGWRRLGPAPADQLVYLGGLCALMLLITPVSHMHYYAMALPLVSGLWLRSLLARPGAVTADRPTAVVLAVWGIIASLPLLPGPVFDWMREGGLGVVATIGMWAFGMVRISTNTPVTTTQPEPLPLQNAA